MAGVGIFSSYDIDAIPFAALLPGVNVAYVFNVLCFYWHTDVLQRLQLDRNVLCSSSGPEEDELRQTSA